MAMDAPVLDLGPGLRPEYSGAMRCGCLELKERADREQLHAVDVLDLVTLVFGAQADLPDAQADAGAVEPARTGAAGAHSTDARLALRLDDAALAVQVDRPERKDQEPGAIGAVELELGTLTGHLLRRLAEIDIAALHREVDDRQHAAA